MAQKLIKSEVAQETIMKVFGRIAHSKKGMARVKKELLEMRVDELANCDKDELIDMILEGQGHTQLEEMSDSEIFSEWLGFAGIDFDERMIDAETYDQVLEDLASY